MTTPRSAEDTTPSGLWPTQEQLLVLKAALLPAEPARTAFQEWLGQIDPAETFDPGTFRLLPLVYDNMRQHGVDNALMNRLKGIYRLTWYKNHKLFSDVAPVIQALHGAGIPVMLLKGVPLVQHYYRNIALRPMADIDILIPTAMAARGLEVMAHFAYERYAQPTEDFLRYRHAMPYLSTDKGEIDMHWHALCECCAPDADDIFWDHASAITFGGVACVAPDASRMLFHTTIHGLRWNPEPPVRWIADAMTILKVAGDAIQWDAIVEQARIFQLSYRLRLSLGYLARHFAAPVPDDVLARLGRQPKSPVERIENTYVLRNPAPLYASPLGHLWISFVDYCRFARNQAPPAFVIGFTHYLRFRWKLRGRSEMPRYVIRGVWKRLRRWVQPASAGAVAGGPRAEN